MEKFENSIIMGQDIAEYGGVFKMTEGFLEKFGKDRVRNTPLCESAIVGAALGLSLKKKKAIMEMQFADFVTVGFNQIVNNLAKIHYRWGQNADVVIRMPTGASVGQNRGLGVRLPPLLPNRCNSKFLMSKLEKINGKSWSFNVYPTGKK
jgi:2-oxoisovalerate dehydrogenase E1 component